ncbi:prephenate dehydratase [Cryptococcus gattii Ru294]|nr:prephenate dehydratase [Cryptococcus gattii Ru294]
MSSEPPAKRMRETKRVEMAFLGPRGTYGEQAARAFATRYSDPIDLVPCTTITATDVYNHSAPLIVLPLENTLQGGVLETLDCLLSVLKPSTSEGPKPPEREIVADFVLPIRHCLVVRKGTKMEEIKWVRSHEQALGQSSSFLAERLPGIKLEKWSSTAGAAVSLLQNTGNADDKGAAICSKAVLDLYPDHLEVLHEGTQYGNENYTRFLLLTVPSPNILPKSDRQLPSTDRTSFIAVPNPSLGAMLLSFHPSSSICSSTSVSAIHTRPAGEGVIYKDEKFPRWCLLEVVNGATNAVEDVVNLGSLREKLGPELLGK